MLQDGIFKSYCANTKLYLIRIYRHTVNLKGVSNPNNKYVLLKRALWTMNFDTSIIKNGWKMGKLWTFREFNMANIQPPFWIFN